MGFKINKTNLHFFDTVRYPCNNSRAVNPSFEAYRNAEHSTKYTWLYQLFRVRSDIYSNCYATLDIHDLLVFLECIMSRVTKMGR